MPLLYLLAYNGTMVDSTPPMPEKTAQRQREIENQLAALRSPVTSVRVAAARRLGDLQAGSAALLDLLQDTHDTVRTAAAQALGSFGGAETTPEMIDYLLAAIDDPSEKVCQAAIRSLGMLRAGIARPEIEEFLDDPNPFITGAAILALARLGASDLSPQLAAYLSHENAYIKMQAVRAVGILKYEPAGPEILRMLQATREERLAEAQVNLQARLEWREDDLYSLQNQLIRSAGDLQLTQAVPLLIEIAQKDIGLRGLAVEALIAIGADIAPELLTNLLSDPSVYLRKRLLALITQHNYLQALPLIHPLLRVENASTRSAALQAVTQMQDAAAIPEVTWMSFHDSNPFVRVQAVQSLASLAGPESIPQLLLLAGDANFSVRRAAAAHLAQWETGDPAVLAALARFAAEYPEDALTSAIIALLEKHHFDQNQALPGSQAFPGLEPRPQLFPPEMLAEIPTLRLLLDRWRTMIRQNDALPEAGLERIESALSCLIDTLNQVQRQD